MARPPAKAYEYWLCRSFSLRKRFSRQNIKSRHDLLKPSWGEDPPPAGLGACFFLLSDLRSRCEILNLAR